MKLETILNLKKQISKIEDILETIEYDYLQTLDDDLWTVDLSTKPYFTREYDIIIETDKRLTKKYVIRFCEDYGLSLKDYRENEDNYRYVFELEKDIMSSINKLED